MYQPIPTVRCPKTGEMGTSPLVMVGMKLDFTNSDQPRGGHILRSHWSWLVQNVFLPTMTNHAVQNIHFQLVLVGHKNVILGFDVTTVPTSTNGAVAIIQPLCWYWLVHKSDSTNQYQRCGGTKIATSRLVMVGQKYSIYPLPTLR